MSGMTNLGTLGEVAAAAGDAYAGYQGGLDSPANQAAIASAVASALTAVASNGYLGAFAHGLGTGAAPAAGLAQVVLNVNNLQNAQTPQQRLEAALGIIGGAASTIAGLLPISPQKAALTAAAIAASAAQQLVHNGEPIEQAISDLLDALPETLLNNGMPWDDLNGIDESVSILFKAAQDFIQRSDPLILDLDGDGLETRGNFDRYDPKDPVYFDHDLNGAKESTGWVMPDDGFLVLDRNGNGVIDNGAELFGNHTPLSGGGTAADGFAALVQEDTNADGKVDNTDARFADLRVWRDLNQDGISEASELTTLADNNIAYLYVAKTEHLQSIANGNQIADLGTYVKTDSSTGGLGETHRMADVNLVADPFRRQFITSITPETAALPDMRGSGAVRDLREAEKDVVWVKAA